MNLNPFSWFAKRPPSPATARTAARPAIQARYDNAQYTDENARQWWMSDILSAKAANSFNVRRTLRMRSRYECANNPYLFGITDNNADDLVGSGPTLQVTTDRSSFNKAVQNAWQEWADEIDMIEKVKTCKLAKTVDGEGFLVLKSVEELYNSVKLYPCDIEADQVSAPAPARMDLLWVDGLTLHPITGRPISYQILKHHPGDLFFRNFNPVAVETVAARHVIQWFKKFRPGQVRGIPTFTSSLDLFSELRSYRRAILQKAQTAANLTAVLEMEGSADATGTDTKQPFDNVPIDRGTLTTLPGGNKLHQYDTGEPGQTYESFRECCLGEACRPLSYPVNLALGTSQKFNFSSSKLDHTNYREGLKTERGDCDRYVLDRLYGAWWEEAIRVPKLIPQSDYLRPPPHEWHWPGFSALDAKTDTAADIDQLNAGTTTWQKFWASRGYDWREVMAQQAAEREEMDKLKLVFGEPLKRSEPDPAATPEETADAA